jgi:CheY-like chemotaxis protein
MKQYKLVIVENDEDERFFMKEAFKDFGSFEILGEFVNGDTLLEWLDSRPSVLPDVILSDLNMPGKNGYDLLTEIKVNPALSDIHIVITSTSPIRSVQDKCLALGASDYLVKPEIFVDYGTFVGNFYEKIPSY